MPAALLKRLKAAFPRVAFIQRFGTSETGSLPIHPEGTGLSLNDETKGFAIKVVEGELWIRSPSRALGYLSGEAGGFDRSGWFRTGDQADTLADGSIQICGRRAETINVHGEKVFPEEIESVLAGHPMVGDCRVGLATNTRLEQVLAAEIVWLGTETDPVEVEIKVNEYARNLLARHKLPAIVRLVPSIDWTPTLKKSRRSPL
jgi:acyl-CoA synthetase (AMP-forming)/AMP-acid ligase II